jgi:hypothetical protein
MKAKQNTIMRFIPRFVPAASFLAARLGVVEKRPVVVADTHRICIGGGLGTIISG